MRIAYIVPYVPNLIRVRPYHLISCLSRLGVEVTVFTVSSNERDVADAIALRSVCREVFVHRQPLWRSLMNCLAAVPSNAPLQSVFSFQPGLVEKFQNVFEAEASSAKFDMVHVEHLRGSMYGTHLKNRYPKLPIVWDSVDCISHLFELTSAQSRSIFGKLISTVELKRTRRWEGDLVTLFDHVVITSQTDRNALLSLVRDGRTPSPVSVVPNGVDSEYFRVESEISRDAETIVFSGKMSYHANISMVDHLVKDIMPRVWGKKPKVQLVIVGKDPPQKIKMLTENPLITVTGTVEDIRPYLRRATVAVVPLVYGAGIQNKILEAMACGTPVVTNSKALSALEACPGQDVLVADRPDEFATAILRLIENPSLHREVGLAGSNYVKNYHDWTRVGSSLVDIYQNTIASQRS